MPSKTYDAVVVGAGAFGAWIAFHLHRAGQRVLLVDAYGAANSRASSGGESRILRCGYGDLVYGQFAKNSLPQWRALSERAGGSLFHQTGVLRFSTCGDSRITSTIDTLAALHVPYEVMEHRQLCARFPQFPFAESSLGVYEPESGAQMARRSVQALVAELRADGVQVLLEAVLPPIAGTQALTTVSGLDLSAANFVFASGPWLPKLFPRELGSRIFSTRQEVFFFGTEPGDRRFCAPDMPCWVDVGDIYGVPDVENRGLKIGVDEHGVAFDPDTGDRIVHAASLAAMRRVLAERLPALHDAPLLESRVCQYENTSNGDFLLDRHPEAENIWFAGGGSGHGFKHGPAVGEYMAGLILGNCSPQPRFSYASKGEIQRRAIY